MNQDGGKYRKPFQPARQSNVHDVGEVVDLDVFIDYEIMNHDVNPTEVDDNKLVAGEGNELLAYMAGRSSSAGDIRQVLAANRAPDKSTNKSRNIPRASKSMDP